MAPCVGFLRDSIEGMVLSVMITPLFVVANKCCHNAVLSTLAVAFEVCLKDIFMNQAKRPSEVEKSSIDGML